MRVVIVFYCALCFTAGCSHPPADRGQVNRTSQIAICQAIAQYQDEVGTFPESLNDLITKGNRSFLPVDYVPTDPWGNPYRYKVFGQKAGITSDGPDKKTGTLDDIYREVLNQ